MAIALSSSIGQRSETIHRANLSAIVRELHIHGPLSRSDLVERTGLTRSTIRVLTGELAEAGLVRERSGSPSGIPGRPSALVSLNADEPLVLAFEIAIDSMAAALVGPGGVVHADLRVDRPRGHLAVEDLVADLRDLARQVAPDSGRWSDLGIGIALVGIVRGSDGLVTQAPNLGWRDVALGAELAAALGTRASVAIGNDADLGALAELRRGAAVGERDMIYISGEYGVGGGIVVDGRPLAGAAGFGGEVGHMPINPAGAACGCGAAGCWETEVGEPALLARAGYPVDGGRDAVDALIEAAERGSRKPLAAILETGAWIGRGLAGLVNLFNPNLIVLGGVFGRLHRFIAETLAEQLERLALRAPRSMVRIVPSALGQDAPLLGAAELAFEPLLANPAAWLRRASSPVLQRA